MTPQAQKRLTMLLFIVADVLFLGALLVWDKEVIRNYILGVSAFLLMGSLIVGLFVRRILRGMQAGIGRNWWQEFREDKDA